MKNKKAGFEMSITTIVILVIAVIMLIMGLFLVRTIMCRGISMATTTLEGAEKEIAKLFMEGKEITCLGGSGKDALTIIPGKYNIVGCSITPSKTVTYNYTFVLVSPTSGSDAAMVRGWLREDPETPRIITVGPGEPTYITFAIEPDSNAPETTIVMNLLINGTVKDTVRYTVKSVGWFRSTVC